jgi:tetratricopeptide (TPR) repeat protein
VHLRSNGRGGGPPAELVGARAQAFAQKQGAVGGTPDTRYADAAFQAAAGAPPPPLLWLASTPAHSRTGMPRAAASALLLESYIVRGDALSGLGITEQAQKYFSAALQLDPDNNEVARKLKTLRRVVTETARLRGEIDKNMAARKFEAVVGFCTEGLTVDKESKKLMTEMHLKRARAYASIAKAQVRQAQAAPSSSSSSKSANGAADASATVYAEDYLQRAQASWRKCLSDSTSVLYYDNVSGDGVAGVLLKADALIGLDRFEECISEVRKGR